MEGKVQVKAAQQPAQQPKTTLVKQDIDFVHPTQKMKSRKNHYSAKIRKLTSKFETEHPEDMIVFDHHHPGMGCTPEAEALRDYRESQKREPDCWAHNPKALGEYIDIFDLRYLYDDEEIKLERQFFIEQEEENPSRYWWSTEPSEVDFYLELRSRARAATKIEQRADFEYEDIYDFDIKEKEKVELWVDDGEAEWNNFRFVEGIGFVSDAYDCGYDEPNDFSEDYPKVEGEIFLDYRDLQRSMKKSAEQIRRRTVHRNVKDSEYLQPPWRSCDLSKIVRPSDWAD